MKKWCIVLLPVCYLVKVGAVQLGVYLGWFSWVDVLGLAIPLGGPMLLMLYIGIKSDWSNSS